MLLKENQKVKNKKKTHTQLMQYLMKTFGKNGTEKVKVVIPGSNNGNTEALTSEKEAGGGGTASRVSAPADVSSASTGYIPAKRCTTSRNEPQRRPSRMGRFFHLYLSWLWSLHPIVVTTAGARQTRCLTWSDESSNSRMNSIQTP